MEFAEIRNRYEVRKLSVGEQVKSFDCGDADLNDFILNEAVPYRKAMLAVTYVFEDKVTHHSGRLRKCHPFLHEERLCSIKR